MRLLALDTASELCSVAVWLPERRLSREVLAPRAHAELILPMIDELLTESGSSLAAMDAIAFGRGPGAFTGVRLAVAIAQGLGFAVQRPLIGISDLRAIAARALAAAPGSQRVLVCQDARMQEVYWGCFEQRAQAAGPGLLVAVGPERVGPAASVEVPPDWSELLAAGPGFAAYPQLAVRLSGRAVTLLPQLQPRAQEIAELAAQEGLAAAVPAEQALPVYLRDRVAVGAAVGLPPHS